ncbi:MAG: G-D-S-L family lipolytic protein [Cyclobacteriaceae bacterium]|nr:G-D-S-L family lipolytic protein [Cyclobacteriaceae bacterium]
MKTWIKNLIYLLPALVLFSACEPQIDVPAPSSGSVDFSNYLAVGNSLTAGFADGGLYADAQMQSFPYILHQQMNEITSSDFTQPDVKGNGSGYIYLTSLAPTFDEYAPEPDFLTQLEGPFNNLGVPGIRLKDITFNGYGSSPQVNPYFFRMLGGKPATTSYLEIVQESQPTFFTCWMGNNDVLGYATSGGAYGTTGLPVTGLNGLTDPELEFKPLYLALVAALSSNSGKGVLVSVPDITKVPFFTTVPFAAIPLDKATSDALNSMQAFGGYNAALDGLAVLTVITPEEAAKRKVVYKEGSNPVLIQDNDLADLSQPLGAINPALGVYGKTRQATAQDLLLLTASSVIGTLAVPNNPSTAYGVAVPLPDQFALTNMEIGWIKEATASYNTIIKNIASASDLAYLDIDPVLTNVKNGVFENGVKVNSSFIQGGAFSLDGVHLTPRGYAIVANAIIETINTKFNSSLAPVNINDYRAVVFP